MGKNHKRQAPGSNSQTTNNKKTRRVSANNKFSTLKFDDGAHQFRLRLICALITLKPITIRNIRADDIEDPGLHDHEVAFLKLIDLITDGSSTGALELILVFTEDYDDYK